MRVISTVGRAWLVTLIHHDNTVRYSAKPETGCNGLPTPVRYADERLVLR